MSEENQTVVQDAPAVGMKRFVRLGFVSRMEAELRSNQHKGDWHQWRPDEEEAKSELLHHVEKLLAAMAAGNADSVAEYAADVANIAMKIDERLGSKCVSLNCETPGCDGNSDAWDHWLVTGYLCRKCGNPNAEGTGCLAS